MANLYVGIFGAVGIFLRYGADSLLIHRFPNFPASTLIVNILGCFAAGCVYILASRQMLSESLQVGLLIGLCGGFTTFSAYALQSLLLMEKGQLGLALTNFLISPILGFAAVYLGYFGMKLFLKA